MPIGRPIANTVVRLLDPRGALVPDGAVGELCIAGAGVALGYLGRPERTAERFVAGQGADGTAYSTVYRTGDLARWRSDGELEYLGRIDDQIKIHGVRVELSDLGGFRRDFLRIFGFDVDGVNYEEDVPLPS